MALDESFATWLQDFTFAVVFNRYGYRFGHVFVAVADREEDVAALALHLEGSDLEALEAARVIAAGAYAIGFGATPDVAMTNLVGALRRDFEPQ